MATASLVDKEWWILRVYNVVIVVECNTSSAAQFFGAFTTIRKEISYNSTIDVVLFNV